MSLHRRLALIALLAVSLTPLAADDTYRLDGRNTKIGFTGTKKDGKHDGGFKELKGTITVKGNDVTTAQFKVDIDLNSMFTDNAQLTNHLKSPDFFNVRKNPKANFTSTKVVKNGSKVEVHGKLTLNGTVKEIVIPCTLEVSGPGISMESSFEINRHDWKISYGGKNIDEKVKLTLEVAAQK
ncbi:MAG: YceI family protein [Gemmatales bacterium]